MLTTTDAKVHLTIIKGLYFSHRVTRNPLVDYRRALSGERIYIEPDFSFTVDDGEKLNIKDERKSDGVDITTPDIIAYAVNKYKER